MSQVNHRQFFALLLLPVCLLSYAVAAAQETEADLSKPLLFWNSKDSRGPRWDLSEEPGAYLYREQLSQKRPKDKIVYIAYGSLGDVARYLLHLKGWLRDTLGVREDLIYTFDGGREKELRYVAWLIPEGAEMPKVNPLPAEDENAVIEFTDYPYADMCEVCGYEGRYTLAALIEALKERPHRKAYLEFYACAAVGRRRRLAEARRQMLEARQFLKEGGVASSRILVKIKAGGKKSCRAQIWLLPPHLNSPTKVNPAR